MVTLTAIIASMDDVETLDELLEMYDSGDIHITDANAAVYTVDVPADTTPELATLIGRGLFFSNDWGMDWTVSDVFLSETPAE
jgi:hypothetical protein